MWPGRAVKKEGEEGRREGREGGRRRSLSGKTGKTVERESGREGIRERNNIEQEK